jgi:sugar O-acyltransferase (sialic acid O-acetyltransferase NeuD family)
MTRVVLFGDGQVAELAHFFLTHDSAYEVVAFTVDGAHISAAMMRGLPIVPFEEVQTRYPPDDFSLFISVGYSRVNKLRESKYHAGKGLGYTLVTYISSKATIWPGSDIGDNCFIQENIVVQPFAKLGNNVVVWSGCHIGHDSVIGDHCFLAPHVVVSGNVTVEPNCFLGAGATIRDGITIARECVIGAGSLIMKDTGPREVHVGQRAQLLQIPSDRLPPSTLAGHVRPHDG